MSKISSLIGVLSIGIPYFYVTTLLCFPFFFLLGCGSGFRDWINQLQGFCTSLKEEMTRVLIKT
jgi:hypothetical protein